MRWLSLVLGFFLLASFVQAGTIQTPVNISISNQSQQAIIQTASNSGTYAYETNGNYTQIITLSYSDSSCTVTDNLTQTMRDFMKTQKVNGDYYTLYLGCYTDKATCTTQLQAQKDTTTSYKAKYDGYDNINQQNVQCQANLQNVQAQLSPKDATIGSCQSSLTNEKNNRLLWGAIGFVVCALIWWRTNESKKVNNIGESDFPARR